MTDELQVAEGEIGTHSVRINPQTGEIRVGSDATIGDWGEAWEAVARIRNRSDMLLAGLVVEGRKAFGEQAIEAEIERRQGEFALDYKSMKRVATLATSPLLLMRPGLDAQQALVIAEAALPASEAEYWAELAVRHGIEPSRLEASIAQGQLVSAEDAVTRGRGGVKVTSLISLFSEIARLTSNDNYRPGPEMSDIMLNNLWAAVSLALPWMTALQREVHRRQNELTKDAD